MLVSAFLNNLSDPMGCSLWRQGSEGSRKALGAGGCWQNGMDVYEAQEEGWAIMSQGSPSNPIPPASPTFSNSLPGRNQVSKHKSLWGIFCIQTRTEPIHHLLSF